MCMLIGSVCDTSVVDSLRDSFGRQNEENKEGMNACDLSNCVAGINRQREKGERERETSVMRDDE